MDYPQIVLTSLSFLFMILGALFMFRSAKYADGVQLGLEQLARLERKMLVLEQDFGEKYDNTLRKLTNRQAQRNRRENEESEDLNRPNGGILMNGSNK
jgi:hypothetical protein